MITKFSLAFGSVGRFSINAAFIVALGCSPATESRSNNGSGGGSGGGGGNANSAGANANSGGILGAFGGSTTALQGGGGTGSTVAGNSGTSGGTTAVGGGGGVATTMGGTAGAAGNATAQGGAAMVSCTNTDKSVLPIDKDGWVDKACNTCGIQGAFYWYGDANTAATLQCNGAPCVKNTPPFQATAPGPGMCISGKATGSTDDYGAGIGLSLNDSGGMMSVKNVFDATKAACGNITGFDITLTGNTNGMPVRIGFSNTADGSTISPFIPVGDPAGTALELSGSTQLVISKAAIPADWMSDDPSPADPAKLYDLQVQIATDQAKAGDAFSLCVTSVKPHVEGGSGGSGGGGNGGGCKANSVGTISANTGLQNLGSNYGYHNNVNNLGSGSQSVTGYYGANCAAMTVMTSGITSNNNAPASYPSIVQGWHWGSWAGAYSQANAKPVSALTAVTSSWSFTPPAGQKWNVSYDMWVAQSTGLQAPDGNTLEVMVWLDYSTATTTNPIGEKVATFSAAGTTWEVWYGPTESWHTVTYRRSPGTAPVMNFDLLPFLKDAVTRGTGAASWNLLSVQAGFELFNATSGGSIDSYSLTIN